MTPLGIDWVLLQEVKRDICFLFHEQTEHPRIDGDLAYGTFYRLPYWEFLTADIPPDDRAFVREGCLVMILAMAWDLIQHSGSFLADRIETCRLAVTGVEAEDERTATLLATVRLALDTAERGEAADDRLEELSVWVNATVICGYFQRTAAELVIAHQRLKPPLA
jgi:hypothetical protein